MCLYFNRKNDYTETWQNTIDQYRKKTSGQKINNKKEIKTKTISVAKYRKLQMNNTDPHQKNQG
jgi:hypothetical protein